MCLMCLAMLCAPARAEDKPYVVLALSGGGIKGYAHVGVLEVLEKEGVGIAGIVGTSMGSIIGSAYASGYSAKELGTMIKSLNLAELVTAGGGSYFNLSDKAIHDVSLVRPEMHYDADGNPVGPLGLIAGTSVLEFLVQKLNDVTVTEFDRLPIPFACVATDLVTGEKVVLRHGSLASAVRASMAIPAVFDPWEIDGRLLIDGGMVSNMPVETAKELFPGYPVIAVNLTSELEPRENLGNWIDVINQSITILTMQNVEREGKLADFVINPHVKEYPMLGTTDAEEIIQQGRDAATQDLPKLREIFAKAPRVPIVIKDKWNGMKPEIVDVIVKGVPDKMASAIREELLGEWLGKPVDMKGIMKASEGITKRDDVRSVDYDIVDKENGVAVVFKVNRIPARILKVGGYGDTVSGVGAVTAEVGSYDVFTEGDMLNTTLYLSDKWGANFSYFWDMDVNHENFWEGSLSATRNEIDSSAGTRRWQRFAVSAKRHFTLDRRLRLSAGATAAAVRRSVGFEDLNYWAPTFQGTLNMTDNPDDPVSGWLIDVRAQWPDQADAMLMRAVVIGRERIGDSLGGEIIGGFTEGDMGENEVFAAYLGARSELYSFYNHPLPTERFLWWRAKLRYPIKATMFGDIVGEVFGGQAYAWDHNGRDLGKPWEVGLALCTPRRLIDGKVYAVYSDAEEWTFGVSIGIPDWDVFHIF